MGEKPKEERKGGVTRRDALVAVGGLAVGAVIGASLFSRREVVRETATVTVTQPTTVTVTQPPPPPPAAVYPRTKLANIAEIAPGRSLSREYAGVRVWVIKLRERAEGGVGPDGDVVAFVPVCTHMGGPLVFDAQTNCAVCQIHYSQFDLTRAGKVVVGHATQNLVQLVLEYDEKTGDIYAVGINQLVYGKFRNL